MNNTVNEKIIDLLCTSVMSEGGDGDAIWLCKHTPLEDIVPLLEKYNEEHKTGWTIEVRDSSILWGSDQEWVEITDLVGSFNDRPHYITLKINY
jgi:hypothetical protein